MGWMAPRKPDGVANFMECSFGVPGAAPEALAQSRGSRGLGGGTGLVSGRKGGTVAWEARSIYPGTSRKDHVSKTVRLGDPSEEERTRPGGASNGRFLDF